ncbi:MAG TPA: PRC-barrel domain-containing protein [Herpetosiphonaceae bacterium]
MRKGTELVGKPVVAFDSGEQCESIKDLLFDQNNNQLLGFLVDEGGWFSSARVLPLQSIQSIGPDAVIVPAKNAVVNAVQVPEIHRILERNNVLRGTRIMTTDGRDLGTMVDLYFDEQTGAVEGYEVSGGLFADAYSGRSFVPAPQTLKIGEDVAFVPPETADLMEEQVGGIRAAAQSAGETLEDTTARASASLTNTVVDPAEQKAFVVGKSVAQDVATPDGTLLVAQGQSVTPLAAEEAERQGVLDRLYRAAGGRLTAGISQIVQGAVASTTIEQARGRRAQRAVRTNEGVIIAAPSQIVTEVVIDRARTYHKEQELLDAVGLSTGDAAQASASTTATSVGERVQATAQQTRAEAGNLWDRVKASVNDFQTRTEQQTLDHRIKDALGRPVSRVILDPQDRVILNVGELITHQAIDTARQAGVLDILLSSVYDKDPDISTDELRASERGSASLEEREHNAGL